MSSFRRLALGSLLATFALIGVGGLVRSTGSGLGCDTSWPDCSGRLIPDFTNHHVVIEFSHRLIAGVVMILIGALAYRAFRLRDERPSLFGPSLAAFALVLFQAGLGAVVVKVELEAESVVIHLLAALSLLALLVYVNFLASGARWPRLDAPEARISRRGRYAAGAALGLLLVGSYVSGVPGAGRAVSDWPLMGGKLVPDLAVEELSVHFFHRLLAAAVGVVLLVMLVGVLRRKASLPTAARLARVALGLFVVEVLIGALNVWTDLNSVVVTLHLLIGTLIFGSLVTMSIETSPRLRERLVDTAPRLAAYPSEQRI
jgi:cytochrome c oxidase assembly protein subunit 15